MKNKSGLFKINFIYFILICAFVAVRILFSLDVIKLPNLASDYIGSILIQVVIMFALPLMLYMFLFKKKPKETFKDFKYNKINFKAVLISIAIGVCVYIVTMFVGAIFSYILALFGYSVSSSGTGEIGTWGGFLSSILLVAILPAICEETAHRGLLMKGFSDLGATRTIIYSGLLFGLMHLNISQFFYATIVGCFLVVLVMSSGSIIPAMIVHFMNNLLSVYFSYAQDLNLPLKNAYSWFYGLISNMGILSILMVVGIVAVCVFLIVLLTKALFKQTYGKKFEKVKNEIAKEYLRDEVLGQIESPNVGQGEAGLIFDEEVDIEGEKRVIKLKIPFERMGLELKPKYKPTLLDNIFFYGSIALGAVITIFTFIWGIVA